MKTLLCPLNVPLLRRNGDAGVFSSPVSSASGSPRSRCSDARGSARFFRPGKGESAGLWAPLFPVRDAWRHSHRSALPRDGGWLQMSPSQVSSPSSLDSLLPGNARKMEEARKYVLKRLINTHVVAQHPILHLSMEQSARPSLSRIHTREAYPSEKDRCDSPYFSDISGRKLVPFGGN